MEPTRDSHATLVDLLDRILDKGLVINAEIIILVAGIPLIGINLRAALAGMETMLKYGVMQDWDERTRIWETENSRKKIPIFADGEEMVLKMYGSHYYSKGIYTAWRPGYFYLTNTRLILYRKDFGETTFQISLDEIKGLEISEEEHFVKEKHKLVLYIIDKQDQVHRLSAVETADLKEAIEQRLKTMGILLAKCPELPRLDEEPYNYLLEGEEVTHRGKKEWYLVPAIGIQQETWRPGHLFLTNKRFCWCYDFEKRLVFNVPLNWILSAKIVMKKNNGLNSIKEKTLDVVYINKGTEMMASFTGGDQLNDWADVLNNIVSLRVEVGKESCPQCGKTASDQVLLEEGCPNCGWMSPKLKRRLAAIAV
ncbi:MAG: gas vesicle protein GvpJ [Mariniphaga sp.]